MASWSSACRKTSAVPVWLQDVGLDGLTQRRFEPFVPYTSTTASSSRYGTSRPTRLAVRSTWRVAGDKRLEAGEQEIADGGGQLVVGAERQQFLGEERVALGAGVDLVQQLGRGGTPRMSLI